jgi:hypothetical protein
MIVLARIVATGAISVIGVTLLAQQPAQNQTEVDPLKTSVRTFGVILKDAVERGGQQLASWARQFVPGVTLTPAAAPLVTGVPLPDYGMVFDVKIAELLDSGKQLWAYDFLRQRVPVPAQARPAATQSNPDKVTAAGVVAADPMDASSVMDPDKQYGEYVRQALISAILDGASVLPMKDGQTLAIVVTPIDVAVTNVLDKNPSRTLILTAKGADLLAFRKGEITRDQLKERIFENRF